MVVLYVGIVFLTITNDLQDLVLNSTALAFLIEARRVCFVAFFGGVRQRGTGLGMSMDQYSLAYGSLFERGLLNVECTRDSRK